MKTKYILIVINLLATSFLVNLSYAKSEAELLFDAVQKVAKKIVVMPGLKDAKKVSLLMIATSHQKDLAQPQLRVSQVAPLSFLGVWKVTSKLSTTPPSLSELDQNLLLEDVIIDQLVKTGKYTVIEANKHHRGELSEIATKEASTVGKILGVDTIIIGTHYSPIMRKEKYHAMFFNHYKTIVEVKINVRTVDVNTNQVTSSDTFSAVVVKKKRAFNLRWYEWVTLAGLAAWINEKNVKYDAVGDRKEPQPGTLIIGSIVLLGLFGLYDK